ncbi:uncharacterized protein E0L32_002494 [Thyridium curvatum]|uniref:Glycosyltransferase family 32 protein n=1 Tax=Thyridium curvatum TaxID=1093900 RepID=A0A507BFF0_9PEZI|nr:uncharacterized protein E0L32_002494 [Thyridium curvatum]TPX18637.1 hypothetical protein E0L32_002494 [Thyridium curvatum]
MLTCCLPRRATPGRPVFLVGLLLALLLLFSVRHTLYTAWTLAALPLTWGRGASSFVISREADAFDVTFESYDAAQTTAGKGFEDRVPAILHHVMLGHAPGAGTEDKWKATRQSCLDLHPGWEHHLWTDETASAFVADKFPHLKPMWDSYPFPIQRVDALRHMVLYEYGGVVLDMDLRCRRSLGPLRRFGFVAPEAHPVGVSVGFVMAERHNPFVGAVVDSLATYNHRWLGLPYATIMFSTGCHFVSSDYKVLRGPPSDPKMHRLNGAVSTPLFEHLGSSAWHTSLDCLAIVFIGRSLRWLLPVLLFVAVGGALYLAERRWTARRRGGGCSHCRGHGGAVSPRGRSRKASEVDLEECSRTVSWVRQQHARMAGGIHLG